MRAANSLSKFISEVGEEIRSQTSSALQYQEMFSIRTQASLDAFRKAQLKAEQQARAELDMYKKRVQGLYDESLVKQRAQRDAMVELNKQVAEYTTVRPRKIDESLEQFRRLYNDSISLVLPQLQHQPITKSDKSMGKIRGKRAYWSWQRGLLEHVDWESLASSNSETPFAKQIETLQSNVHEQWRHVTDAVSDVASKTESTIQYATGDLNKVQEQLAINAARIAKKSIKNLELLPFTTKKQLKKEKRLLEEQLHKLEQEGTLWVEQRVHQLESTVKVLQDKLLASNSAYEDLLNKRRASVYYSAVNDQTLSQVLSIIDTDRANNGWKEIKSEDGIAVYRRFMGAGPGAQYACVMCHGIIDSSAQSVFDLFDDHSRMPEYNSFCARGYDVETVAENSIVTWTCTPPVFPFKPRDFVSLVHTRKLKDGTMVVLNRATTHPNAPPVDPAFVRGRIVLAANIIQPLGRHKCKLTMLTQLDPGGFAPPTVINHLCTLGPVGFFKNVQTCAKRPKARRKQQTILAAPHPSQ